MADTKCTALSANSSPAATDIVYCVQDPGGTPSSKKITFSALVMAAQIPATGFSAAIHFGSTGATGFYCRDDLAFGIVINNSRKLDWAQNNWVVRKGWQMQWSTDPAVDPADVALDSDAAGVLKLTDASTNGMGGAAFQFKEISDPGAGGSDTCRLYCRDSGGGKTQLCAVFASGAVQVIATQP